jgi:hypothetical protein
MSDTNGSVELIKHRRDKSGDRVVAVSDIAGPKVAGDRPTEGGEAGCS